MRSYGTVGEIAYSRIRWCIYAIAYEYHLIAPWGARTVYVDNNAELHKEIEAFERAQGDYDDER